MDARQQALETIARIDATLAQPRDPEIVARAAAWEASMPRTEVRNTTGHDAATARPQPAPRVVVRQAPGVSADVMVAVMQEVGGTIHALQERVAALEAERVENAQRLLTLSDLLTRMSEDRTSTLDSVKAITTECVDEMRELLGIRRGSAIPKAQRLS